MGGYSHGGRICMNCGGVVRSMADGGEVENGACKNPSCNSYGSSHPNCMCYAHGGEVRQGHGGQMKSHALDKWAKRGQAMAFGGYAKEDKKRGEVEDYSPMPSFMDEDEDEMDFDGYDGYAYGGPVMPKNNTPSFSVSIMQDPGVGSMVGPWHEDKDTQDEPDLGDEAMGRRPKSFAKGGFVNALRSRRG